MPDIGTYIYLEARADGAISAGTSPLYEIVGINLPTPDRRRPPMTDHDTRVAHNQAQGRRDGAVRYRCGSGNDRR